MPQKSGFFDTTADDPREYPAREFAEYFARFVGNGVFGGGEKLKVLASGKDMNVSINLGYGWINGYMYSVFDAPLVLPIQQATTQDRIDRIVLRLDVSTPVRAIRAIVLQGNPGTTPQVPAIVRSGDIYDLSLSQVLVKANTSTIQPHQITDERLNNQVCGIVTGVIQQADTTAIFNEFQSWLKTKTAEYQKQWDDFLKGIQDQGFATTQYVDQKFAGSETPSGAQAKANAAETNAKNASLPRTGGTINGDLAVTNTLYAAGRNVIWEIDQAKQSGVDAKNRIAGAVSAKGVPASAADDFPTLAWKIGQITTGVPMARITTSVSEYPKNFLISEGDTTTWGLYYIIVTGLSFQAKGIVVFGVNFFSLAAFDFYTNPRISVRGASYNHQVVYRDTLPQLNEYSILATITPTSFMVPVTRYEDDSNKPVSVIVYG